LDFRFWTLEFSVQVPPPLQGGINPKYSLRCVRFANANLKFSSSTLEGGVNPKSKIANLKFSSSTLEGGVNPKSKIANPKLADDYQKFQNLMSMGTFGEKN
jgi:hypothetical protein